MNLDSTTRPVTGGRLLFVVFMYCAYKCSSTLSLDFARVLNIESSAVAYLFVAGLLLLPIMAWRLTISCTRLASNRRRFERFEMKSEINVRAGEVDLLGTMQTISLGGISFRTDEKLEMGRIVNMKISSPLGNESIDVEGSIVWNENNKSYGVQFTKPQLKISSWTEDLMMLH